MWLTLHSNQISQPIMSNIFKHFPFVWMYVDNEIQSSRKKYHSFFVNLWSFGHRGIPARLSIVGLLGYELPVLGWVPERHEVFRYEIRACKVADHPARGADAHMTKKWKYPPVVEKNMSLRILYYQLNKVHCCWSSFLSVGIQFTHVNTGIGVQTIQ